MYKSIFTILLVFLVSGCSTQQNSPSEKIIIPSNSIQVELSTDNGFGLPPTFLHFMDESPRSAVEKRGLDVLTVEEVIRTRYESDKWEIYQIRYSNLHYLVTLSKK
jgi:hypothetical protein